MSDSPTPLQKKKRPVALIILGILGLIVSISGLVSAVYGILYIPFLQLIFGMYGDLYLNAGFDVFTQYNRIIGDAYPWMLVSSGLRLIVYGIALTASIGLLKNKPWGRIAGQVTAGAMFAQAVLGTVLGFLIISPMMEGFARVFSSFPGGGNIAGTWSSFISVFSTIMKIDMIISLPLACIVPAIVLVVLNKPHIRDHYRELRSAAP
jgi:hypothetical protein